MLFINPIEPNPSDGNYLIITADAVAGPGRSPILNAAAERSQIQELHSGTVFRNTNIRIKVRIDTNHWTKYPSALYFI